MILNNINCITGENDKQLKTTLRHFGYTLETEGTKKRNSKSVINKIDELV